MRSEAQVLQDLRELSKSAGYAHIIGYFCLRDNITFYDGTLKPTDLIPFDRTERLLRNELSALLVLMLESDKGFSPKPPSSFDALLKYTQTYLHELHDVLTAPIRADLKSLYSASDQGTSLSHGPFLREAIFYCPESATTFQHISLFLEKYKHDEKWFLDNIGLRPNEIAHVVDAISRTIQTNTYDTLGAIRTDAFHTYPLANSFQVFPNQLSYDTGIKAERIQSFLDYFSSGEGHAQPLSTFSDYNPVNAYPIVKTRNDEHYVFQIYSLTEAIYETPAFRMLQDDNYKNIASDHRGTFLERVTYQYLGRVFKASNIFRNVTFFDRKGNKLDEADVLVVYADRIIVFQLKTKRLTVAARKGSEEKLNEDFRLGVQGAYDQAFSCSQRIMKRTYTAAIADGADISDRLKARKIYPCCAVSDHYPALSLQAREFLQFKNDNFIEKPFVLDVFTLDAITEFLCTPLYFVYYIATRCAYFERIMSGHEVAILGYHLSQNLWLKDDMDLLSIDDDFAAEVDVCLAARRTDIEADMIPKGILTAFEGTHVNTLIEQINHSEDVAAVNFGFLLLSLSSDTIDKLNEYIGNCISYLRQDGKKHDLTMSFQDCSSGVTMHIGPAYLLDQGKLSGHCDLAKYRSRADEWFGIAVEPKNFHIVFGTQLIYKWSHSFKKDIALSVSGMGVTSGKSQLPNDKNYKKIGRNEPCPCGSGKKYKHCHLKL